MQQFAGLLLAAIVVEGIITYFKTFFVDREFQWQMLVAIFLGVFIAIVYRLDIFEIAGLEASIPYVGMILTGI